jgi:hypothetical protein
MNTSLFPSSNSVGERTLKEPNLSLNGLTVGATKGLTLGMVDEKGGIVDGCKLGKGLILGTKLDDDARSLFLPRYPVQLSMYR